MSRVKTQPITRRTPGPKSKYDPVLAPLGYKLALLGATTEQIADVFGIDERTLRRWQSNNPELDTAIRAGKDEADAKVAHSLYRRAVGFKRKSEKIFCSKDGNVTRAECTDYYPPDTTACIFWLKNRRPEQWRDAANKAPPGDPADASAVQLFIDPALLRMSGVGAA